MLALLAWVLAGTLGHALFLFLAASVIAFLLNPLVRAIWRGRMPRGLAVAVVYLSFAAAMIVALVALGTVVVEQTRSAADRVDAYLTDERGQSGQTDAERDVDRLQGWLDAHGLRSTSRSASRRRTGSTRSRARTISGYTQDLDLVREGAAFGIVQLLFSLVLIIVISIYMLLDMPKLERVDRPALPAARRRCR